MAGRLLLLFIVLPIVELWLLIKVGGLIGVIPTIALVILTALIGSQLVRRQGMDAMQRIRDAQARGEAPALPMMDGAALLLAGFMLITPGFISDTLGFLLLIPRLRERLARTLISRLIVVGPITGAAGYGGRGGQRSGQAGDDSVIEGEYQRKSEPGSSHDTRIGRDDR